jgi:flagella basal body P-ring formation protein FlgA
VFRIIFIRLMFSLLGLVFFVFSARADETVTIKLKGEALVFSRVYTLKDIAELGPTTSLNREKLTALEMGFTPRPGQLAKVPRFEVATRLEREFPGFSERLRWEGADVVQIRGTGVRLDAEALHHSARKALIAWIPPRYKHVSVQRLGKPISIVVPRGEVRFQPKLSAITKLKKRIPVWVDVLVDGQHFQTVPIWFAVSVDAQALAAKGAMDKKHELSANDVVERVIDIAGLADDPLDKLALEGQRLVRRLEAGEVVTVADVEPIPAVSQGELITVYARHGSVSLAVTGIALNDGDISQLIEVKNPGSGESYQALVIGQKKARVN